MGWSLGNLMGWLQGAEPRGPTTPLRIPVAVMGAKPDPVAIPPKPAALDAVMELAVPLIQYYEACKLAPYLDARAIKPVATIGWGNTRWENGEAVRMTDKPITPDRADKLFAHWLARFNSGVIAMLPPGTAPAPHAAFLSLAYNVGLAGAENSTALKRLAGGDLLRTADAFAMWNKAGGKVLKGLQRRRHAEGRVLLGDAVKVAIIKGDAMFP